MAATPEAFLADARFHWHQRFHLGGGVYTPGTNDVEWLLRVAGVSADLSGKTVLDVGTAHGGVCFEAERRGAARVVGVDITPPEHCGFHELRSLLGSRAEYVQARIYELPELLEERFDVVFFWGVLYHLRHPLLGLDSLRQLVRGHAFIETAVADDQLGRAAREPLVRFHRGTEYEGDGTVWFVPTVTALLEWCRSSGLSPSVLATWAPTWLRLSQDEQRSSAWRRPRGGARRCMVRVEPTPGEPEFKALSWAEGPLRVRAG